MSVPDLYAGYHFTKSIPHDVYPSIAPTNPNLQLSPSQQTVLISGGGTGIGLATAKFYAQAGAKNVVITGRRRQLLEDAKAKIEKAKVGVTVYAIVTDVSSQESVEALWKEVAAKVGKVDVLINNAGTTGDRTRIGDGSVGKWLETMQTNLFGVYLMTESYIASLSSPKEEEPKGTVINISSQLAFVNSPGTSAYSLSKSAIIRFTELLHSEHPHIRAFSTHPGIIPTALSNFGDAAKDTVELAAGLNLWLASPRADFLRGRYTTANWDVEELERQREEIVEGDMLRLKLEVGEGYGADGHAWRT